MRKIIFLSLALTSYLSASEVNLYANTMQKNGDIVRADEDVLVYSDMYFIRADKALYNETTGEIELFGNVNILKGQDERSSSDYAKINLNSNKAYFQDFFFANSKLEVWFQSKESNFDEEQFIANNCIVSSCNVENPDWQIKFSKGKFNRDSNYVHLYNARLYIKDVPVFYTPYLGFSANTSRKTGLLVPKLSLNESEGLYYEQPIYFSFQDNWDGELSPQLRSDRGFGLYSTIRFMDSAYSNAELNFGFFNEQNSYFEKENLKNKTHYGLEFKYLREDLIKALFDTDFQEALYIDATYLNDVDYLNLGSRDYRDLTSLVSSKLNYFLADANNYYGAYANYYIDTSKTNNKDTLQEYPSFQYHRFLNGVLEDHIQYSFDANFHRYYRQIGDHALQSNFNLPISYHTSFFDDFLHLNFKEDLSFSLINYADYEFANNEHFFRSIPQISLYTDLSKAYESFYHTLLFGMDYFLPSFKSGEITRDYLMLEDNSEYLNLKTVQYFYNDKGQKKFKHRLNLNYDTKNNRFNYTNNLVEYYFSHNISMSNELQYSQIFHRLEKSLTGLNLQNRYLSLDILHAYTHNTDNGKRNFISTSLSYSPVVNYTLFGGAYFDTTKTAVNMWEVGYTYQRKCWNYSLAYRDRIDPQLTSAGINAKRKSGFFLSFNFYPLGGVKYDLVSEEDQGAI